MELTELKSAITESLHHHIPFEMPADLDFTQLQTAVEAVAHELGYTQALPHCFKHQAWTFHLSPTHGLRWGYVFNDQKVGWFESRNTTPLPERDLVMHDSEPVFGVTDDLIVEGSR